MIGRHVARAAAGVVLVLAIAVAGGIGAMAPVARASQGSEPAGADTAGHAPGGHGAAAGEHETPSIDLKKLGLQLLNFAVLVFILAKFGGTAINKALATRHQQMKADLASAAEVRAAAEAKLARQEARLGSLEREIAELQRAIKAEAEAEKARLIAAAEERAAWIKSETTFLLDQQVREAEVTLRRQAAEAGLAAAEAVLRQAIGAADQQRLLDTFVNDVARSTGSGSGAGAARTAAPPSTPVPGRGR